MLWNSLVLALRAIRRNLLRSFLTILGIVIGVAAVITMVTLGGGATVKVTEQIASLGSNLLIVRPGSRMGPGASADAEPFDKQDAEAIADQVPGVAAVSASAVSGTTAIYGNVNWSTTVTGVDAQYLTVRNWDVALGRGFTESELRAGSTACMLGETVRRELFGGADPIGSRIRLNRISCEVVGVLRSKGQTTFGSDQDDIVLIPLRAFQRRIAGNQDIRLIQVSVAEGASSEKVERDISRLLRERRRISALEENDFRITDMKEIASMLAGTTQVMTGLLGAVAAVSLLVGGIGIMNIMLVSVTERTREIGIRLAVGAQERDVLTQFLVEAVMLSSFGGLFGVIIALVASVVLSGVLQVPFVFNPGIVFIAFLFAAAVGVIFGYVPARRAARLDPIEALRHE